MLVHMAKHPKVSVITPSFNQGRFLRETIESVLGQSYPNLEYWVIDGGSTDDTVEILKGYGKRIRWVSEKDKGQTDAINKGLRKATGDILMYINSDDVMAPGTIKKVVAAFTANPGSLWLTGDYEVIDEHGETQEALIVAYKRIQRWLMRIPFMQPLLLALNNPLAQPSTWWRRSALEKAGRFNDKLHYVMDYEYWLRLQDLGPFIVLDDVLSRFRVHSLSKGSTGYASQMAEQYAIASQHYRNPFLLFLHRLHNELILLVYRAIRSPKDHI